VANVRQTNFSAGELEPLLHGRTDLPLFGRGLKTMRNFVPLKSGAAMSRPGTKYIANTYNDAKSRLVRFVYSDELSYVIEFGVDRIRIYNLGVLVTEVLATTIAADDLERLKFAQVGNVLTVAGLPVQFSGPYELRRVNHTTWSWAVSQFSPPELTVEFCDIEAPNEVTSNFAIVASTIGTPDADHPAREWQWLITAIVQDLTTGVVLETTGAEVEREWNGTDYDASNTALSASTWAVYPDMSITLKRGLSASGVAPNWKPLAYRIYRGRGGLFGFIGQTTTREFVDVGEEPDYSVQPPMGVNPLQVFHGSGPNPSSALTMPQAVTFFQEKRVFGGASGDSNTPARPATLFLSATGDYYNFDPHSPFHVSGEALEFELASRHWEEIRHLVAVDRMVALTSAAAWSVGGVQGSPLDFDSVEARVEDEVGATHVTPVVIDGSVLFIRAKGSGARALISQGRDAPFQGVDISEQSRHLFVGTSKRIVDWAYAEDPWGVVWAAREDGALLSLTFSRDREMMAWARHDTANGVVESVCSVPEGEEDAVYLVVKRVISGSTVRYIERMTSRVRRVLESDEANPAYVADPGVTDTNTLYPTDVCVDCAITYTGAPTLTINNLEKLEGKSVYVVARGSPQLGPYTVTGGSITLDLEDVPEPNAVNGSNVPIWVAHVGMAYQCDLETLSIRGDATLRQKTVKEVGFELDSARGVETGQDFDHLQTWEQREVGDEYNAISAASVLLFTPVDNTWDKNARVVLRQSLPLPVTVVGISREVVSGED
jgi:hypothetical protein